MFTRKRYTIISRAPSLSHFDVPAPHFSLVPEIFKYGAVWIDVIVVWLKTIKFGENKNIGFWIILRKMTLEQFTRNLLSRIYAHDYLPDLLGVFMMDDNINVITLN